MSRSSNDRALAEAKRRQAARDRLGTETPEARPTRQQRPSERIDDPSAHLWTRTRAGARAGRGFRFQDAVATLLLLEQWENAHTDARIVPEGYDDVAIESSSTSQYIQVKSRRETAGEYSLGEFRQIAKSVAETWTKRRDAGLGTTATLILERTVTGTELPGLGEPTTDNQSVKSALAGLFDEDDEGLTERFIDALVVSVCLDPHERAVKVVARVRAIPDSVAEIIVSDLRARVGAASDANLERSHTDAAGIEIANVDAMIDQVLEAVNLELLEEARALGVCESIDWNKTWNDPAFQHGSHVVPAHISSGLLIPREGLSQRVIELLTSRRLAVVAGPSGTGKSALGAEAAYETRATYRWQGVHSLEPSGKSGRDAISMIVSRIASLRPNPYAPVGVLIDDAGHHEPAVLDRLLRRLADLPDVGVIVTIREEDRFTVPLLAAIATITPLLDDTFAEELWKEYRDLELTTWAGWKEPHERANGLLLEYSNLLTEGDNLDVTIRAQVAVREADPSRHLELEIIRLVSCANQFGVGVAAAAVQAELEATNGEFVAGYRRLVDEHLVVEREDGLLRPLHELRSRVLADSSNPFGQDDNLRKLVAIVPPSELGRFLRRSLEKGIHRSVLIGAAAVRLTSDRSLQTLVAVVSSLRLDGLRLRADEWKSVLDTCGVEASDAVTAYSLSRTKSQPSLEHLYKPAIAEALKKLAPLPTQPEMGPVWDAIDISLIDEQLAAHISQDGAQSLLQQALSVLRGIDGNKLQKSSAALKTVLLEWPVDRLVDVMEALRHFDPDLAATIADSVGVNHLIERILTETPWLASLEQIETEVVGKWIYFDEEVQPDVNGSVVEVCRRALAVAPRATLARVSAVDAKGAIAMMSAKHSLTEKAIPRENLPAALEVAENRAAIRALSRKYGAGTLTAVLADEAQLLRAVDSLLPAVLHAHLAGHKLSKQSVTAVVLAMGKMWGLGQPEEMYTADEIPGTMGDYPTESGAASAARALLEQTIPNLVDIDIPKRNPALAAMSLDRVIEAVEKLVELDRYRYLADPPDCVTMLESLKNLRKIAAASARGDTQLLASMRAAAGRSEGPGKMLAAANLATSREHELLLQVAKSARQSLLTAGFNVQVEPSRRDEPMISWPPSDLAITMDNKTLPSYMLEVPALADAARELRDVPDRRTWIALRTSRGYLRSSIFQVANEGVLPLGNRQPPAAYAASIAPDPISSTYDAYLRAARHCAAVAAVIAVRGSSTIADVEGETLQTAWDRLLELNQEFGVLAAEHIGNEYAAGLDDVVKTLGRAITEDIASAGKRAQEGTSGWDGVAELTSLDLLDFSPEQLQAEGPATSLFGMLIVCAEIEDDFANADSRIQAMTLAS